MSQTKNLDRFKMILLQNPSTPFGIYDGDSSFQTDANFVKVKGKAQKG